MVSHYVSKSFDIPPIRKEDLCPFLLKWGWSLVTIPPIKYIRNDSLCLSKQHSAHPEAAMG